MKTLEDKLIDLGYKVVTEPTPTGDVYFKHIGNEKHQIQIIIKNNNIEQVKVSSYDCKDKAYFNLTYRTLKKDLKVLMNE